MKYLLAALSFLLVQNLHAQLRQYKIGDNAFCGIVFFVENIDSVGRQRGLVCAPSDQDSGVAWYNGSYLTTYAIQDHLYAKGNADTIITMQGSSYYAATAAANFLPDSNCTRWYLPSRTELITLYDKIARNSNMAIKVSGKFKNTGYWSSLEAGPDPATGLFSANERHAYVVDFYNGRTFPVNKSNKYRVRAIREFRNYTNNF